MSRFKIAVTRVAGSGRRRTSLVFVVFLLLNALIVSHAAPPPLSLPHSNSFLVTGNYGVGTVDLPNSGSVGGFLTGTINVSASEVPSGRVILSAFLYWETITSEDPAAGRQLQLTGVKFRGLGVDVVNIASATLTGGTASCFSSGGGGGGKSRTTYTMNMMRADVRRLLPVDAAGRLLVNDQDLTANGYPLNTVTLPEAGTGNQTPQSAGATLLVIWQDLSQPLRTIQISDGIAVLPDLAGAKLEQTIRGIYQSASAKSARLTFIGGGGQPNGTDREFFKTTQIDTNGFPGTSSASDRSWASKSYDVSSLMTPLTTPPSGGPGQFGETVTATVDHTSQSPYDCLSWGAIIFSAAVKNLDGDAIPDGAEDAVGGLTDAHGRELPDFSLLGASSSHKDTLVQMDAMFAGPNTSYGLPTAPYNSKKCIPDGDQSECTVTDYVGHNHMPKPAATKILIDAYKNSPIENTGWAGADSSTGIFPHLDVGDPESYIAAIGEEYRPYFFPLGQAKGGNLVREQAPPCAEPPCQFAAFPGTVGWLDGLLGHTKDFFDPAREGLVGQVFYVHARGFPKSINPCLVPPPPPTPDDPNPGCGVDNPDFYVPWSQSGVAQNPGGKGMVALGFWDRINFVATPELQASVTLHELGHFGNLQHGGPPPIQTATSIYFEPNYKPNYLSVMNYAFVVGGMRDDNGKAYFDYSRNTYDNVAEPSLTDAMPESPLRFRTAWFAPLDSPLAIALGATRANRFSSGAPLPNPLPDGWVDMGRVEIPNTANPIDWNGDFDPTDSGFSQDVNFDGVLSGGATPLRGFHDWDNLRLDQIGGGETAAGLSQGSLRLGNPFLLLPDGSTRLADGSKFLADGSKFLADGSRLLADGSRQLADGSRQLADGSRQLADGSIRLADGSRLLADGSRLLADGSRSLADGSKALADGSITLAEENQEQTTQHWADIGHAPPQELTACVIGETCSGPFSPSEPLHRISLEWREPTASNVAGGGTLVGYHVFRARGDEIEPGSVIFQLTTDPTPGTCAIPDLHRLDRRCYVDTEELPDTIDFVYFVKAVWDDGATSFASNNAVVPAGNPFVPALNEAPVAVADSYTTTKNTPLVVPARGVLENDTDVDSPAASLTAVRVFPPLGIALPSGHSLTLNLDGSFTYTPKSGFTGTVFFDYKVKPGTYTLDPPTVPMSLDSNKVTVTITVNP